MKFDISTLFWMFFIFVSLQPLLKKRFLVAMRQRLIATLEKKRNSRVIVLIHRQETMSLLGFPVFRYIDIDDSEEVIRAIHLTDPAFIGSDGIALGAILAGAAHPRGRWPARQLAEEAGRGRCLLALASSASCSACA